MRMCVVSCHWENGQAEQENEITDVLLQKVMVGCAVKIAIRVDRSREQNIKNQCNKEKYGVCENEGVSI